jgi:hypothetical protein
LGPGDIHLVDDRAHAGELSHGLHTLVALTSAGNLAMQSDRAA